MLWCKMRLGFHMLFSEEQIPLLQNDFWFWKVFQLPKRWKNTNEIPNLVLQNAGHSLILKPYFIPGNSPHTGHKASILRNICISV